jgi:hypothetical protein
VAGERRLPARNYHEAGHAVVARVLGVEVTNVTIVPDQTSHGSVNTMNVARRRTAALTLAANSRRWDRWPIVESHLPEQRLFRRRQLRSVATAREQVAVAVERHQELFCEVFEKNIRRIEADDGSDLPLQKAPRRPQPRPSLR